MVSNSCNLNKISSLTVERLTLYLRILKRVYASGITNIFSHELSKQTGVSAPIIRKDLSQFGQFGNINTGYNAEDLIKSLSKILGVDKAQDVIIVGVGNLGRALLGYKGFEEYGFNVKAVFDADETKINRLISGIHCYSISEIDNYVKENNIKIGVIAVPAKSAQQVTDILVKAGVKGILNFAPIVLKVPSSVKLSEVDFVSKLEKLSYYINNIV